MIIYSKGSYTCIHKGDKAKLPSNSYAVRVRLDDTVPSLDEARTMVATSGGYMITSKGEKYNEKVWTGAGDVYMCEDYIAYVASEQSDGLSFHKRGACPYKFADIAPVNWLSNYYSRMTGVPPENMVCKGGETWVYEPDREIAGLDAEYYCYNGYDLMAVFGVKSKTSFVVPVPTTEEGLKYTMGVLEGKVSDTQFQVSCEPFEEPADGFIVNPDLEEEIAAIKGQMSKGKPVVLDYYQKAYRVKFFEPSNNSVNTTILFGVPTYDPTAGMEWCMFTGSDAIVKIDECLNSNSFELLADVYICNDYINQVLRDARSKYNEALGSFILERCNIIKEYGDNLVYMIPTYIQGYLDELYRAGKVKVDAGLFKFSPVTVPEQNGRSPEEWLRVLCAAVGRGFDSKVLENGVLADLPDAVKLYLNQAIKDVYDENVNTAEKMSSEVSNYLKKFDTHTLAERRLEQTYWVLLPVPWKKTREHDSLHLVSETLGDYMEITNCSLTALNDEKNLLSMSVTAWPWRAVHYKEDDARFVDEIINKVKANLPENATLTYRGRTSMHPKLDLGSTKLGVTTWNWFSGIKEIRHYHEKLGVDFDPAKGMKFDIEIELTTAGRNVLLDLSSSETFNVVKNDGNAAAWRAYANYILENATFIKEDLVNKRPFCRFNDSYASIDEAAAFGALLRDAGFLDEAIDSLNQSFGEASDAEAQVKLRDALAILNFIRETMLSTSVKEPCLYLKKEHVENKAEWIRDNEVYMYTFDMVRAIY